MTIKIFIILIVALGFWGLYKYQTRLRYIWSSDYDKKVGDISAGEALRLAGPYLKSTLDFYLASVSGKWRGEFKPGLPFTTYVFRDNKFFYIFYDDYPYKAPFLISAGRVKSRSSVRIDIKTHEVTSPQK